MPRSSVTFTRRVRMNYAPGTRELHGGGRVVIVLQSVGMHCYRRTAISVAQLLAALTLLVASAPPAPAQDDPDRVLREFQGGERECSEARTKDFVAIGERLMGRQFPSEQAHESMDELMRSMMGEPAERQMHEFLGRRAAGCGGSAPEAFGGMMGMMGSLAGGPMMGAGDRVAGTRHQGAMFGRVPYHGDDDWGTGETLIVLVGGLLAAAVGLVGVWVLARRSAQAEQSPLDTLRRRYAQGEIDTDEYERRRAALGSSP